MSNNNSVYSAVAAILMGAGFANAQQPVVSIVNDRGSASLEQLSDNGEWAVGYGKSPISELGYSYPKLYNVKSKATTNLYKDGEENRIQEMMALDVTDDGSIVIGQYDGKPAIWRAETGEWTSLPVKAAGFTGGHGSCITPDGKYAIGTATNPNWNETIVMWDLTGDSPVEITPDNLPLPISMAGELQQYEQIRATDLSADGSKFIGVVAFSYAGESWSFLYDMATKSWEGIGFDVKENGSGYEFTPNNSGYYFIDGGQFRPGANEIAGPAWLDSDVDGIYTYDIASKKVSIVEGSESKLFGGIDKYGIVYASTPSGNPIRNWEVKVGKYWYDFKLVARQIWNFDWQTAMGGEDYAYTGTFVGVSDDGLVLLANEYTNSPYDSYVTELPESLQEVCPNVNLLDNYFVTPVNNSSFALLREVKVLFDRNIEIVGDPKNAVTVVGTDGSSYNSIDVKVDVNDSRMLLIAFRNRQLQDGVTYTLTVPYGVACVAGDAEKLNPEITVSYKGRPDTPVAPVSVSPEDGIKNQRINASSNPVTVTFDAEISPVEEGGSMYLYSIDEEGTRSMITQLSGSITGNALSIFPVMEQRLAVGFKYEIVVEANTVSDISGANPNEEFVIHYIGDFRYDFDPRTPFSDDFNGGISTEKWMLYDGDMLEPADEPAQWGFTAEIPWWVARDEVGSSEMAAVSHSMYNPAGKSDDWLVTKQIYIADESAILTFKSQSYKKDVEDRLKVYIYESDDIYTALTSAIVDKIRYAEGALVYDELQSPGEKEDLLAGDWKENVIKLDKYAGKTIYIAFVNDNRNKSAVFIDDVIVSRDVKYLITNLTPSSMVAKDEVTVKGILSIESQTDSYKGYELTLVDADGNVVSTVADAEKELASGDEVDFTFPEPLKTPIGKEVAYTIALKIGDESDKLDTSVKNLAVQTTKRVVIEEYTGQACPNCPLGHAALEHIERDFGDLAIPLTIHTYPGDNFATPQASELEKFLGLTAAPTARINRGPVASPMDIINEKYYYKDNGLWYDYVVTELNENADADVNITSAIFDGDNYNVTAEVVYALDMDNRNVNIFTVIAEDGLVGIQDNNRADYDDPALGEWGKGGIYGTSPVVYTFNDVVRTFAGTTCNGTGGYVPASVVAGQPYTAEIVVPNINRIAKPENTTVTVMLIDASTGRVVNANRVGVTPSGIDAVEGADRVAFSVENGNVVVKSDSITFVDVYAVDGTRLASQAGEGEIVVDVNGYRGVALVTARNANGTKTEKVFVK